MRDAQKLGLDFFFIFWFKTVANFYVIAYQTQKKTVLEKIKEIQND